ncbi:hypothetical protein DAI43_21405, partial [Achromobacter xylosoxidans]
MNSSAVRCLAFRPQAPRRRAMGASFPGTIMLKSALVVDQDEFQRAALARMLGKIGVPEVATAHDGASAVAAIQQQQWDLVIVDLDMADRTGLQMIDALADAGGCGGIAIASRHPTRILQAAATYARNRGLPIIAALGKPLEAACLISMIESLA